MIRVIIIIMSNVFQVGDRVTCIPFKQKGKVATVRFFGPITRKFGTWVGLELDEPTGECSGDFNGEYLFECKENYGLVLRNTQVKLYDPNEITARNLAGPSGTSKLTPLDESLFGEGEDSLLTPLAIKQPSMLVRTLTAETEETKGIDDSKKGWREKLEKLQKKKLEEKQKSTLMDDPNLAKMRDSFAPAQGIQRNPLTGQLEVQQSKVVSRPEIGDSLLKDEIQDSPMKNQSQIKSTSNLPAMSKLKLPKQTLEINTGEKEEPQTKQTAKDRLEENRLQAVEKRKELQAKQDELQRKRNERANIVATPRGSATMKVGLGQPTTTPTPTTQRTASNLKGAVTKTTGAGIAKANSYQSNTQAEKPSENLSESRRPAMTQPQGERDTKRQPSATRTVGLKKDVPAKPEAEDPKASVKKIPAGKVATATSGKTPMRQVVGQSDSLNKQLITKDPKSTIATTAASITNTAEIKRLEAQLKEKEEEIVKINQDVETHKNKIGALMIKHTGEIKRQQEEISLLQKQVEAKNSQNDKNENSAQILAQQALLEQSKHAERVAQERITELEEQISQIKQQLSDARKEINQAQTNASIRQDEYEQQLLLIQQQAAETNKNASEALHIELQSELQLKLEQSRKEMAEHLTQGNKEFAEAQKQIEKLKQNLKDEQERREEEVEILKLEKDSLIDEKAELMEKYMESAKVEEIDPLKDLGIEEIKIQNKKLRQAITTLTFGFEEERKRLEQKMNQETEKDRIISEQDARLKHMDLLLDEVESKEQERAEMEEKLEEIMEYEIMVEEMVQEIANKEGEVEEMQMRMVEIEEEHAMLEELVENLETYNKELQGDIAEKDKEIAGLVTEKEQLEDIVVDQDGITQKYKERQTQLTKQISVLNEQLQITVSSTGNRDQVSVLLEKQQILINKLRDAARKSLENTKEQILSNQQRMRSEVIQQMLPDALAEEALLPALDKIQMLNITKHKATLLVRQICEVFIDNAKNIYEEADQLDQYINTLLKICLMCHRIIECCTTVQFQVANMTPGQYDEITKLLVWLQVKVVSNELDSVLELLIDEALSQNFESSSLEQAIQQIENLQSRTEKMFVTASPEELKQQELSGKQEINASIEQQRRQNLTKYCSKLSYRSAAMKMALTIVFVPHLQEKFESTEEKQQVRNKVGLIYQRLMQTVLKIDMIDNKQTGEEYFQESLNSDLRLQQKYDTIKNMWDGTPAQKSDAKKKNWFSMVEAVERDITQMTNDYKFKKLTQMIDEKYGEKKIDLNDIYMVDFEASGPWRSIAQSIRTDLQDMGVLKQKNTNLIEQHKQVSFQALQLKKDKEENEKIIQTLEMKLGQALAKAEQLNALELERDEQSKQIQKLEKKLKNQTSENVANKASLEETKKKLEETKKKLDERPVVQEADAPPPGQSRSSIRGRQNTMKASAKPTSKNFFEGIRDKSFKDIKESVMLGRGNTISGSNPAQILQTAQVSEDMFINIVNDLQADRMRLRGKDMMVRLTKLQKEDSAFAQLIKQNRDSNQTPMNSNAPTVKLNAEEQAKIEIALKSVESLKTKFKRQMAQAKIFDLTKIQEASGTSGQLINTVEIQKAVDNHQKRNTESFNFLVVEARNKMNNALEFLFQKDSKLRKLQTSSTKMALQSHMEIAKEEKLDIESVKQMPGEVKIGSLKLIGKIQIPNRKVILDENALAELRRNVQLLTI